MRRKIELWVAGSRADLSDQNLILYNFAFTDAERPTAVKNSYSKQVTLPGTPANDAIFGHFYRLDRVTEGGFNAMRRTPFTIMDEAGQVLQGGYLKLDGITRSGRTVTGYKVSLYGGLGSFLYSLGFDENGDKRTLADLDYLGGGPGELDFNITAANVLAAWDHLYNGINLVPASLWDVLNFAPAYNGNPEGDFDSNKAIGLASDMGLPTSETEGGKTYTPNGGYVVLNLSRNHSEWDMKDLRCYLQRPVISVAAFLYAVQRWATANGFSFDYSSIPATSYRHVWKTLPTIPSLGSFKQTVGNLAAAFTFAGPDSAGDVLSSHIDFTGVQATMNVSARASSVMLGFTDPEGRGNPARLSFRLHQSNIAPDFGYFTVFFVQLQGFSAGVLSAVSKVRCFAPTELADIYGTPSRLAELAGYTPAFSGEYEADVKKLDSLFLASDPNLGLFNYFYTSDMDLKGGAVDSLKIAVKTYSFAGIYPLIGSPGGSPIYDTFVFQGASDNGLLPVLYTDSALPGTPYRSVAAAWVSGSGSASYASNSSLRSGAIVEKAKLLSSKHTPADYLLALGTQFGWVFRYDEAEKRLTVTTRNAYFNTGLDVIDLTERVDTAKAVTISPNYAGARIYEFAPEMAEGHFAAKYKNTYGFAYGIQRVDTGYQFDAAPVNLLDKSVLRAAATILEAGPYWNVITSGGRYLPSVFVDSGNTYTMWAPDGTAKPFDVPTVPSSATIDYINNENHPGYDNEFAWKLDLHDADGKPVDGEDILVYYQGSDPYPRWHVSDDTAAMLALNPKPCWLISYDSASLDVPNFHRYDTNGEWNVQECLDFGLPREADMPYIVFDEGCSAYDRGWRAFLRDRYDQDSKVLKCRVDFRGLEVGPDLLRRFFWYEGSLWVLNKMTNYSLTTWDPVECEFIQVRDIEAYTNGQI